jgi:hypothetical protein
MLIWTAQRKSRININLTSHSIQFKKRPTYYVEYSQQIQHARNRRHGRTVHFLFCCSIAFIKLRRKNLQARQQQPKRKCSTTSNGVGAGSKTKMATMSKRMEGEGITPLRQMHCRCVSFCCGLCHHRGSYSSHTCNATCQNLGVARNGFQKCV